MKKNSQRRQYLSLMIAGALVVLASCTSPETESRQEPDGRPQAAMDSLSGTSSQCGVEVVPNESAWPVMRQTVYVPIYSQVYERTERWMVNLTVTLSIRNTDLRHPVTITAVCRYNTAGQLVERYLEEPVLLASLASTHFVVEGRDTRGGVGASFIVKWRSDKRVNQPVVEAVMISRVSQQGLSFVTHGHIIEQEVDEPATPSRRQAEADHVP